MGILSSLYCRGLKAIPFCSESLDCLAENMHVTSILKNDKCQRYYRVRRLQACSLSYVDIVLFDTKYLDTLQPDELLAVGAHEFTHIIKKHGIKKFSRIFVPSMVVVAVVGIFVFINARVFSHILFFNSFGAGLSSLFVAILCFLPALVISRYVNAKWHRQLETECDLNAVKFANGEAMISALYKASKFRPINTKSLEYRLGPRLYLSLEQRINYLRTAIVKKSESVT